MWLKKGQKRFIYRIVNSGGSFGASPLIREIGLGSSAQIDEMEIKWNGSGKIQSFKNIAANQFIKIKEGKPELQKRKQLEFSFDRNLPPIIDCPPAVTTITKKINNGTYKFTSGSSWHSRSYGI